MPSLNFRKCRDLHHSMGLHVYWIVGHILDGCITASSLEEAEALTRSLLASKLGRRNSSQSTRSTAAKLLKKGFRVIEGCKIAPEITEEWRKNAKASENEE